MGTKTGTIHIGCKFNMMISCYTLLKTGGFSLPVPMNKAVFELVYLSLSLLIIVISAFTLSSLKKLNRLNGEIVRRDDKAVETAERMIDNLFEQELFARRYLILNSPDILALYEERSGEFERMTRTVSGLSGEYAARAGTIASAHADYKDLILKLPSSPVPEEHERKIGSTHERPGGVAI